MQSRSKEIGKTKPARLLLKALETHRAKLGDDHTAIKQMLEKAMNMCNELAWVNSINAEGSPEEYDLGAEFAQYAVDLERNSSWSWLLALAKLRQGDEKASLEVMKRSIAESNEDWLGQWFIMAMVELANGNRQPAVDWYVAASERLAQTYTKWGAILSLQRRLVAQLDYEPAWPVEELPVGKQLESLNRLIADYPPVLQLRATRGLLNVKARKWDAGTADIQEVVKQLSDRIAQSPTTNRCELSAVTCMHASANGRRRPRELEAGLDPESSDSVAWLHVVPVWALSGEQGEAHLRLPVNTCSNALAKAKRRTI